MSLINKMLQDLDARGPQAGGAMQADVKSVARGSTGVPAGVVAVAIVLALALGVGGMLGWRAWKRPAAAPLAPVVLAQAPAPAVLAQAPAGVPALPGAAPAQPVAPAAQAIVAPAAKAAAMPLATPPVPASLPPAKPIAALPAQAAPAPVAPSAPVHRTLAAKSKPARARDASARAHAKGPVSVRATDKHKPQHAERIQARKPGAAPASKSAAAAPAAAGGRDMTAAQRAESEYRDAMAGLQEGRVSAAIASLGQALKLDPRHDAARQTLVGLLLEAKRSDEAITLLQNGLTLEPRQPGVAMLLARLQIERGGSGIDTLMRTLPYAGGNGDYHAFLAGALQRQQRHREAAEQYQAALAGAPQQGVWWMGLGISLQAEQRNAEALAAFQRARDSGKLGADLQAFVDRKLQQLSPK